MPTLPPGHPKLSELNARLEALARLYPHEVEPCALPSSAPWKILEGQGQRAVTLRWGEPAAEAAFRGWVARLLRRAGLEAYTFSADASYRSRAPRWASVPARHYALLGNLRGWQASGAANFGAYLAVADALARHAQAQPGPVRTADLGAELQAGWLRFPPFS
ncbi:hypothetical protein HNR42_000119 [Deinobacterium chartae]|uniref:Uncharacterized protein n=1 Tax=Deinobacterium chartae TaxID=521158 RepID=A0A841HTM9_9DEIO|nr:hypothetical protein [Deinobacterium chartae]MBB6096707.1 hypothetical protein [Deinobacterium chartae]